MLIIIDALCMCIYRSGKMQKNIRVGVGVNKGSQEVVGAQHPFVPEVAPLQSAHLVDEGKLALGPGLALQHVAHVPQLEHRVPVPEVYGKVFNLLQNVEDADDHPDYFVLEVLHAVEVHLLAEVAVRQLLHFSLVIADAEADLLICLGLRLEKVGLSEFLSFWVGDCQFLQKRSVVEPGLEEGKGIIIVQKPRGKLQSKLTKIQPTHLTAFYKLKNILLHLPHRKILLKNPMRNLHTNFLPIQAPPSHLHKPKHPHEILMRATREMIGMQPNHSQCRVAVIQTGFQDIDDECQVIIADIETVEDQFEDGKLSA